MAEFNVDNFMTELERICAGQEIAALMHIEPLRSLLLSKPDEAIPKINQAYDAAVNEAMGNTEQAYVNVYAGGPSEAFTKPLFDIVGAAYPWYTRDQKDSALKQVLGVLDKYRYDIANLVHTPNIREPLLLSDIGICSPLYWPGLRDEQHLWKDVDEFYELQEKIMTPDGLFNPRLVHSDFLVAYAILRNDFTPFGEEYAKAANPLFLNRVMKGIVGLRFGRAETNEEIKKGEARLREYLPESLHDRITPLREEADWAFWEKFERPEVVRAIKENKAGVS
ncbi:MAG: hypothetical protein ABIH72_04495 [archaeon]